jgi:SAM-dependent methyltransferase
MDQRAYWNSDVGTTWAREAALLDRMLAPIGEAALAALQALPGERVLDVGCGAGATSRALAALGANVTGVDVSAPLLEAAKAAGGGPHYLLADAGADALPGPFDALFSRFGVMFFPDPPAAFAHLREAMAPGGRLTFVCWRTMFENDWAREPLAAAAPHLVLPSEIPDPYAPGPFAFGDPQRTKGHLAAAGWRDVTLEPLSLPYRVGGDVAEALDLMTMIGPLARLLREQQSAEPAVRGALDALMRQHVTPDGFVFTACVWLVRGLA